MMGGRVGECRTWERDFRRQKTRVSRKRGLTEGPERSVSNRSKKKGFWEPRDDRVRTASIGEEIGPLCYRSSGKLKKSQPFLPKLGINPPATKTPKQLQKGTNFCQGIEWETHETKKKKRANT